MTTQNEKDNLLNDFKTESLSILAELVSVVEVIEDHPDPYPQVSVEEFCQKIDRLMGAAKNIDVSIPNDPGIVRVRKISELIRKLGRTSLELKNPKTLPVFAAFFMDTIEVLNELIESIDNPVASAKIAERFSKILQSRLEWLVGKISIAAPIEKDREELNSSQLDDLLAQFGI